MPATPLPLFGAIQAKILDLLPELTRLKQERTLKADDSYVTQADILVQETLRSLITTYDPKAVLVSEEDLASHGEVALSGSVYVLDPIDGTENFTSGLPEWGVSLCHYRDGHHAESLLLCPEMRLALGTGDPIRPQHSRIAGISSSLTKEDILALEPGFEYRIIGCCVLNMLNVVRGAYATFENPKGAKVWDIIAGLNLALEHGHSVTVDGKPYRGELLDPAGRYKFRVVSKFHSGGNP